MVTGNIRQPREELSALPHYSRNAEPVNQSRNWNRVARIIHFLKLSFEKRALRTSMKHRKGSNIEILCAKPNFIGTFALCHAPGLQPPGEADMKRGY